MFKAFFSSLKKSNKLKKISRELSKPLGDIGAAPLTWLTEYSSQEKLMPELIELAKSDEQVSAVIDKMSATDRDLVDIYHMLQANGAGQYAGGHYVAASSLVYWQPLYFLLYHFDKGKFKIRDYDEHNSRLFIANRLVEYFANGETGGVRYDGK